MMAIPNNLDILAVGKQPDLVQLSKSPLSRLASRSTLNSWCHSGRLPALKIGGRWFAKSEIIQGFLSGQREAN
jgi:hypothetical protein